ncbi:MAG: holo-ACP synthase [Alphaproteobacteria bacterium]|nr:holo-ACP synthase [Alphaproteobacteria bacterium]
MIIGIGNDICDITRIEKTYAKYGERFLKRIYTPIEQKKALQRSSAPPTLAKRFAAKEACAKALGTGMSAGVFWKDMGVVNDPNGKPTLVLTGGALKRLEAMTPKGYSASIHLTLTDEYPNAQAFVIIEAIKKD